MFNSKKRDAFSKIMGAAPTRAHHLILTAA